MPVYLFINFEPLLSWFSHDISVFQHHVFLQLVWANIGHLSHFFNVEKVKMIILCYKVVADMLEVDKEVGCVQKLLLTPHF